MLQRIRAEAGIDQTRPIAKPIRRLVPLAALAAAAAIALIVLPIGNAPTATAYAPPPLPFTPVSESVAEVMDQAQERLGSDGTGVTEPLREATSTGWYADLQFGGSSDTATIAPQITTVTWNADGSGTQRTVAGEPFPDDPAAERAPAPGTLLLELAHGPGQFPPDAPAMTAPGPAELAGIVRVFAGGPSAEGAADLTVGVTTLLNTWTLPNTHHAALLDGLIAEGDLHVAGHTVDREGREVIGLRATSRTTPTTDVIVLVSQASGRIVGIEEIYTGAQDELPALTGSTLSYTNWSGA